jgi:hypothetical protein
VGGEAAAFPPTDCLLSWAETGLVPGQLLPSRQGKFPSPESQEPCLGWFLRVNGGAPVAQCARPISWLVDDAASVHTDVWGQACHCEDS